MGQNHVSSKPEGGVCERIFKAVTGIARRPQRAMSATAAPNTSMPTPNPSVKILQPVSLVGCQRPETPENRKASGVVPIDFERTISIQLDCAPPRSNEKEKLAAAPPQMSMQNHNGHLAKTASVKEDKTKPKEELIKSAKAAVGQAHDQVPKLPGFEVPPHRVTVQEKPMPKADIVQSEKPVFGSGRGQVEKIASKIEPKQPLVSVEEKPKLIIEQSYGQGAKVTLKVDKDSPAKFAKDQSLRDKGDGGKKSGLDNNNDNSNDKFTDFINRAKLKIRTTSDVGHGNSTPRVDSMNEKVTNFIDRAKLKFRATSSIGGGGGGGGGGGKSVSFK